MILWVEIYQDKEVSEQCLNHRDVVVVRILYQCRILLCIVFTYRLFIVQIHRFSLIKTLSIIEVAMSFYLPTNFSMTKAQ